MRSRLGLLLVVLASAPAGCSGGGPSAVSTTPAAHGPGRGRPPLVMGSQNFTEQRLLPIKKRLLSLKKRLLSLKHRGGADVLLRSSIHLLLGTTLLLVRDF